MTGEQTSTEKDASMATTPDLIPHLPVAEIARRYGELNIPGVRPADESRLIIRILAEIAKGSPIGAKRVRVLATEAGMDPDIAEALLATVTEPNADGDVIGMMGLSQNQDFDIRFTVGDKSLRTWCALDSLFLPLLLDQPAVVEAESALRGEPIRFVVGPEGIVESQPSGITVSLVLPSTTAREGIKQVTDLWLTFCHQIRFFVSPEEAEEWAWSKRGLELAQLTLPETFELASIAWADLRSYVR
jgi:alkylmercury lyase